MSDLTAYQLELWTRRKLLTYYGIKTYEMISAKVTFPSNSSEYPIFILASNMPLEIDTKHLREMIETHYEEARAELLCKKHT